MSLGALLLSAEHALRVVACPSLAQEAPYKLQMSIEMNVHCSVTTIFPYHPYKTMRSFFLLLAVTICWANFALGENTAEKDARINVVLVGATGDLSQKYLWQSLFRMYLQSLKLPDRPKLAVWPAASSSAEKASLSLEKILSTKVKCEEGVDFVIAEDELVCEGDLQVFIHRVVRPYTQLRNEAHYAEINKRIEEDLQKEPRGGKRHYEAGRVFYLSIPPAYYMDISKYINEHARPHDKDAWLRVVMEKPFGSDTQSAKKLVGGINNFLKEEEIYRIDHYLGKFGVQSILNFRQANYHLYEPLLNREHVARIEIVMKETVSCAKRTNFFDDYGIVRDVLQNHLTEITALVAMELPGDPSDTESIIAHKAALLESIAPPSMKEAVLGQYDGYRSHVTQDKMDQGRSYEESQSRQVTFAAVKLNVRNDRWDGVPFILTSGKVLDERAAYVRIVFKRTEEGTAGELMINIQGGIRGTEISATIETPVFFAPPGFLPRFLNASNPNAYKEGTRVAAPIEQVRNAYEVLIEDVLVGRQENFVTAKTLLPSWKVWTPLLKEYDASTVEPVKYSIGGEEVYHALSKASAEWAKERRAAEGTAAHNEL